MFLGQHQHALDPKGRLVLPSSFRDELDGRFYLAIGGNGQIDVWPKESFEEQVAEKLAKSKDNPRGQYDLRMFAASASEGRMDAQFRLPITQELRNKVGLEPGAQMTVIGALDHIEIWSSDRFAEYESNPPVGA
jgi:MraZ protein